MNSTVSTVLKYELAKLQKDLEASVLNLMYGSQKHHYTKRKN